MANQENLKENPKFIKKERLIIHWKDLNKLRISYLFPQCKIKVHRYLNFDSCKDPKVEISNSQKI